MITGKKNAQDFNKFLLISIEKKMKHNIKAKFD
jgi:hypothetical protein